MVAGTLTDYERRRLENIKRNDEMMATLMLQRKATDLTSSLKRSPSKPLSPSLKKPKSNPNPSPLVLRRSLRSQGIPPSDSHTQSPPPSPVPPLPAARRGPLLMREVYTGAPSSDREFIETVQSMSDDDPLGPGVAALAGGGWDPSAMVLKPENVKRFLHGRILSVEFFPFRDRTVIGAGNKFGNLGFWDVDCGKGDGVYVYAPHSAPVSGVRVHPSSLSTIFTSSYDGCIRSMDVKKETFNMIYSCDDAIYSISQRSHAPNSLYFGEGHGQLKILDINAGKVSNSWALHNSRINTIDFHPENTNLMVTSSSDGTACIWDLRNIKHEKPENLKLVQHNKAVHSAFFAPSGSAIATTSFDNNVRIVGGVDFDDISKIFHNNQTGRWLSSFRAIWGWDDTHLFIGNMTRRIDVISSAGATGTLESPLMTAIPTRFAAHPYKLGFLAGATAGGQVYLWTK